MRSTVFRVARVSLFSVAADDGALAALGAAGKEARNRDLAQMLLQLVTSTDANGCPICFETPPIQAVMNPACKHYYCRECINDWIRVRPVSIGYFTAKIVTNQKLSSRTRNARCAAAFWNQIDSWRRHRKTIRMEKIARMTGRAASRYGYHFDCSVSGPPSGVENSFQVDAVMSHLLRLRQEDPTIKSIVVSQFTSFLDVIEKPLM